MGLLDDLRRAFQGIDRFAFEFAVEGATHVRVSVSAIDDGKPTSRIDQPIDFSSMHADPRATAFLEACAIVARTKARQGKIQELLPAFVFPVVLLESDLRTTDAFVEAIATDAWGVLGRLEARALVRALRLEFPEAGNAVRDDDLDLELVDALFGIWSRRYEAGRTVTHLRRVQKSARRHLAPVLIAFIDKTASDPDFLSNAYFMKGKTTATPATTDLALDILTSWNVDVSSRLADWISAKAVSSRR